MFQKQSLMSLESQMFFYFYFLPVQCKRILIRIILSLDRTFFLITKSKT